MNNSAGQDPRDSFTGRERQILELVALGLSNRDIAEELVVAPETVRWYTKQIYAKLGVSGRIPALNRARELGLLVNENGDSNPPAAPSSPKIVLETPRRNLPTPSTPFIGRQREIVDIKQLLQESRLLTLTGAGGTGKTRLALRAASEIVDDFADGIYFVDLAPLSEAGLVAKTVAGSLGIFENPNEPVVYTLKRVLADQEMLLLIDNYEHVIEAAPLVAELIAAAPRLKVLVTSREALHLSGEQEYPVPPLSLPDDDAVSMQTLSNSEAVSLFIQRVRTMLPGFTLNEENAPAIAEICARLDGLPLAIELAAARSKLLSPQAMLSRMDSRLATLTGGSRDAPARQRTLRNALEWSYNLLDDDEKILFARLSAFTGGRSLEAIEAICSEGLSMDVLDALASLIDKSLLQQRETATGEPRFFMLETIHEYARERLKASGEAEEIRRRHAEYFVALAERAQPELRQAQHFRWSQLLELEHGNFRLVLAWALNGGDLTLGVRLAGALELFWFGYGYHVEGLRWTQQFLEYLDEVPLVYHPRFLISIAQLTNMNDLNRAQRLFQRALAASRELDNKLYIAWSLTLMGYTMLGDADKAIATAEEGLLLFRELDHKPGIAQALNVIGEISRFNGDDERARLAYEECLVIARQTGETRRIYMNFANLAFIAQHEGHHEHAIDLMRQSLHLSRQIDNKVDMATGLSTLAGSLGVTGQQQRAVRLFGAIEAALERMGAFLQPTDKPEHDRNVATIRAQLDTAAFEAAWAEGRKMTLEQAVTDALDENPIL